MSAEPQPPGTGQVPVQESRRQAWLNTDPWVQAMQWDQTSPETARQIRDLGKKYAMHVLRYEWAEYLLRVLALLIAAATVVVYAVLTFHQTSVGDGLTVAGSGAVGTGVAALLSQATRTAARKRTGDD